MSEARPPLSPKRSTGTHLPASIGLWLFLVVIPLGIFRTAFLNEIGRETEERLRQGRQECVTEMQRFSSELRPVSILHKLLEVREFNPSQPSLNQPWLEPLRGKTITGRDSVRKLRRRLHEKLGAPPAYILVMGADAQAGYLAPQVRGRVATGVLKNAMRNYFLHFAQQFSLEIFRQPVPGAPLTLGPSERVLRKLLDIPGPLEEWVTTGFPAYSLTTQSPCLVINLPVYSPETGRMETLVQLAFLEKDMHPGRILRRLSGASTLPGIKRFFALQSPSGLPRFARRGGDLVLCDLAPGKILNMARWNPRLVALADKGLLPVLGVIKPAAALTVLSPGRMFLFNLSLALLSALGFLGLVMLFTRDAPLPISLGAKVALGFLLGVLVPIAGIGWMGHSYLRSESSLKGEETLDEMVLDLEYLDRSMRASLLQAEKRLGSLRGSLARRTRTREEGEAWVRTLRERNLLSGLHVFNQNGTDMFIWSQGRGSLMMRTGDFLRGPLAETMLALGAFARLDRKAQEKIQNTVSLTYSVLEKNFDMSFFSELFANAGHLHENPVSGTFQQVLALFRSLPGKPPEIAAVAVADLSQVFTPFFRFLEKRPQLLHRKRNGFEIHYHIYRIPTTTNDTVQTSWPTPTIPYVELANSRKGTANVFMASRTNGRMNNLNGGSPYLAASRIMGLGGFLALAYAVPLPGQGAGFTLVHALLFIVFALLFAVLLSRATTWFLTRPMGPFLRALQATSRGDLAWSIQLESRDEFGELGDSLNQMALGLREKERMSRLVSEDVLQMVARDDESGIRPGGQRVEATVLFSDIRSFTTLSETHAPEQVVLMLNGYFTRMARCIKEHHGVLDKFIGDAIQAVFYPREGEDPPAVRACATALEMRKALAEFNRERETQGLFTIQAGIGLAGGQVVSGCVGSSSGRLDFTVVGRTVQIAAKLEAESKKARTTGIMIEPVTIRAAAGKIRFGYLDRMELESGTRSVPVYELLGWRNE